MGWRITRRELGAFPTLIVGLLELTCVPTRIVFVPPEVTRGEYEAADKLSPEIEICEEIGDDTVDRYSQMPGASGFGFT